MKFIASLESVTEEQWDIVSETMGARMLGPNDPRTRGFVELSGHLSTPGLALVPGRQSDN